MPPERNVNRTAVTAGKPGRLTDVTHVVSQIKTGPTPSGLSERQQRPGKTRGFAKGVGLTLSQAKNNVLHEAQGKKPCSGAVR